MIVEIGEMPRTPGEDNEMYLETLGQRLFWARRNYARLTQQQLRDKMQADYGVDVGRNYISQLETDAGTQPTFAVVRAMAGSLGVSLDFLAGFAKDYAPAQIEEEKTPHYFSAEADEVAKLVDTMHSSQREVLLSVAKNMLAAPTPRQARRAEMRDILDSIERDHGSDMRREIEQIMRGKGLPINSDT